VTALLWPEQVEAVLARDLAEIGGRSLHVCCGKSRLGSIRLDLDLENRPAVVADANRLPFANDAFDTVLCDPPYNGRMQWNHDMLTELSMVASRRIIFQHWFIPATKDGLYKKAHEKFGLARLYVWQGRAYFGRAQLITVFDRVDQGVLL
jgi:hypothetical protein